MENLEETRENKILQFKPIARYRPPRECDLMIKQLDSGSCISENFIRQLCKENKIKYHKSGSKLYVNFDNLLEYLASGEVA